MKRITSLLSLIAITLLLFMGAFHLSGTTYIIGLMQESNAKDFLKSIFGVLFVHPSLHLIMLTVLAIITRSLKGQTWKIYYFIGGCVLVDGIVAFYLGAILPGILLLLPAIAFLYIGMKQQK